MAKQLKSLRRSKQWKSVDVYVIKGDKVQLKTKKEMETIQQMSLESKSYDGLSKL